AVLGRDLWERLRGLVNPDLAGHMRFRNSLVRDAAYEGLPFRRRRELHGRVAETIEASAAAAHEQPPSLALHFFEAGRSEKAWRYCRVAGDRARAVAANVEAARFYERALRAVRHRRDVPNGERANTWMALGAARHAAGSYAEAYGALRRATGL